MFTPMGSQQVKHNTHKQYKANNSLYREIFASVLFLPLLPSVGESKTGQIQMGKFKCLKSTLLKHNCLGEFNTWRNCLQNYMGQK